MRNNKGLTLLEIIVSAVIFALIMAGLTNIFISSKRYILFSRSRMTGGELGKNFLNQLHTEVRQDTWDNSSANMLTEGSYDQSTTLNNIDYKYTLNKTNVSGTTMRRVVLNATWNETNP